MAGNSIGNVSVLLGNGDGTFQAALNVDSGREPSSVPVGDFSGDAKLGLAVANIPVGNTGHSSVSVLMGNGDGTFQSAVDYAGGSLSAQSESGRFDLLGPDVPTVDGLLDGNSRTK